MSRLVPYIVKQGDFITKLAHTRGFNPERVWNDARNGELKKLRRDPDMLCPGDILWIPDRVVESREVLFGTSNRFVARVPVVRVRHRFSVDGQPLAALRYRVYGIGPTFEHVSDERGGVAFEVPVTAGSVRVVFETGAVYRLNVGHTDPANTPSGAAQRLRQLGYLYEFGGDGDDDREQNYIGALKGFQRQQGLEDTGSLDAETVSRLEEEYGT